MEFDLARLSDEHEALLQFLYLAPVGLVQASLDGAISMINPRSAQLLMPLAQDATLDNLFTVLAGVAPGLRKLCDGFGDHHGVVCDGIHLHIAPDGKRLHPQVLSLSLVKLGDTRLMAVLDDITDQLRREQELRRTDAWLNAILAGVSDYAMVRMDPQGRIESWNESIGRVTGYTAEQTVGKSYALFYPPGAASPEQLAERLGAAARDGWSVDDGVRVRADGTPFRVGAMISPLQEGADASTTAYSLIMRVLAEGAALPEPAPPPSLDADNGANEALIQFLYRAPIGLVQISMDGAIEMLNPMSSSLLMPLARDGNLSNLFEVLDPLAPELRQMTALYADAAGVICESFRIVLGDRGEQGSTLARAQCLSVSLLKLDAGKLMAVLADATAEAQREQDTIARRLNSAARIDALTQMPNRRAVLEQIGLMMNRQSGAHSEFAVMFLNFDRFKQINDSLGNAAGDQVLIAMAGRMRAVLRPPGDGVRAPFGSGQMAARIGGDEFVVVLDGLRRASDVEGVAGRLLENIRAPYIIDGHEIICNVSIGIVLGTQALGEADSVLRDASIAMALAKSGSRGFVVFEQTMRERAVRRGDLEGELRRALHENHLFVLYQPVVGLLPDGGIDCSTGVEALVRWRHPVRGVVPPLEFIEVAEECGLIDALGDFVLERACRDFVEWQAVLGAAAPRLLAVNLSRAQLAQAGFAARVAEILQATGMHPSQLQLEVTESLAAQDMLVQSRLHELKALGIKLALDDFGTGYSSLASLHLLPVDTVKIDRSFVSQSDTSAHHRVLIEATVKVARSLGMDTVAEGIETAAQAQVVNELQCDKGQGYLFSRPLESGALIEWIVASNAVPLVA